MGPDALCPHTPGLCEPLCRLGSGAGGAGIDKGAGIPGSSASCSPGAGLGLPSAGTAFLMLTKALYQVMAACLFLFP